MNQLSSLLRLPCQKWEWVIFLSLFIAGIAIRLYDIDGRAFWLDEILSARIADKPFNEIGQLTPKDKPALDYYLQAFFQPFGEPEFTNRLPAAIMGILFLPGIYWLTALIANRQAALLTMGICAFPYLPIPLETLGVKV